MISLSIGFLASLIIALLFFIVVFIGTLVAHLSYVYKTHENERRLYENYEETFESQRTRVRLAEEAREELSAKHDELTRDYRNLDAKYAKQVMDWRSLYEIELVEKLEAWKIQAEKEIRADALAKSKAVTKGFTSEQFAPFQMEYDPRDFRHLGDPVDYIICAGSASIRDKTGDEITEVILLDIKTGKADLNKTQRRIRDAVASGKVTFMTYNPDTNTTRCWPDRDQDA